MLPLLGRVGEEEYAMRRPEGGRGEGLEGNGGTLLGDTVTRLRLRLP